jgi:LAO/AO transport system kinase
MLDLTAPAGWRPPVLATTATTGDGVDELWRAVGRHRAHLTATGELEPRRAARVGDELVRIIAALLHERAQSAGGAELDDLASAVALRIIDPWSAAEQLLQE